MWICEIILHHLSFLSPDLLILDDFGLQKLTAQQSTDLYELIIARHRQSSFVLPKKDQQPDSGGVAGTL